MLTRSLAGWRDQYERMKRSYARLLTAHVSSVDYDDDLLHFFMDSWHLKDWIKNDDELPSSVRDRVENEVAAHRSLRISADLANGWKHLVFDERHPPREGADVTSKSVVMSLETGRADVSHTITLDDGSVLSAQDLARDACNEWDAVLRDLETRTGFGHLFGPRPSK
jgi:hypothetical protein